MHFSSKDTAMDYLLQNDNQSMSPNGAGDKTAANNRYKTEVRSSDFCVCLYHPGGRFVVPFKSVAFAAMGKNARFACQHQFVLLLKSSLITWNKIIANVTARKYI
jgi:hypothetical protein